MIFVRLLGVAMPALISPSSLAGCQCDTEAKIDMLKDPCIIVTAKGIKFLVGFPCL